MTLTTTEVESLFNLPFNDLIFQAQTVHRRHFDPNEVQVSTLLSVKTGGCSEDCGYCSQSVHHTTTVQPEQLMKLDKVLAQARMAKENGATRFCMGAAWRGPKSRDMVSIVKMIEGVRALGLESCVTLGMLKEGQAEQLAEAGLDYYNHNLDTSAEFYPQIIGTHEYSDRLDTLSRVRQAGIKVCCGGIVGMGETRKQRADLIAQLANLNPRPESVPINKLVQVKGTPLANQPQLDTLEFIRTIAATRICLPKSFVRLSAGRESLPEVAQALCFLAGANSVFYGDKLLTAPNTETDKDRLLFEKLGLVAMGVNGQTEIPQKDDCSLAQGQ